MVISATVAPGVQTTMAHFCSVGLGRGNDRFCASKPCIARCTHACWLALTCVMFAHTSSDTFAVHFTVRLCQLSERVSCAHFCSASHPLFSGAELCNGCPPHCIMRSIIAPLRVICFLRCVSGSGTRLSTSGSAYPLTIQQGITA
jgi:hypothetical protein